MFTKSPWVVLLMLGWWDISISVPLRRLLLRSSSNLWSLLHLPYGRPGFMRGFLSGNCRQPGARACFLKRSSGVIEESLRQQRFHRRISQILTEISTTYEHEHKTGVSITWPLLSRLFSFVKALQWAASNIHCEFFLKPPSQCPRLPAGQIQTDAQCGSLTAYDVTRQAGICCLRRVWAPVGSSIQDTECW